MMRKIHLQVESLDVESFETAEPVSDHGGTVRAHITSVQDPCTSEDGARTCARARTDYATCQIDCECTNRYFRCMGPDTTE